MNAIDLAKTGESIRKVCRPIVFREQHYGIHLR